MRKAYLNMIRQFPGGWDAMVGALGVTRSALESRIYERKGQTMSVHTAMAMQALSGTTEFAEAVARESGGVFMPVVQFEGISDMELLDAYMRVIEQEGQIAKDFRDALADGKIERHEYETLRNDVDVQIARSMELLARLKSLIVDE